MSDEQRRDSLADQAAAWVPPWERPRQPAPSAGAPEAPDPEPTVSEAADPEATGSEAPALEAGGSESADLAPADLEPAGSEVPALEATAPEATAAPTCASAAPAPDVTDIAAEPATPPGAGQIAPDPVAAREAGGARDVPPRQASGRRRVTAAPEPAPELPDAELRGALEAILLVVDEPVSELVLAQVLEQPAERIGPMLDDIAAGYTAAGHGFELRRAAGGWRLYTRPEYATYVERFVLDGQSVRLTQAALETLAVVAYKQPVTRSRISAIRGVNCDGVIRTLVTRGLVEECGTETDSGAFLYKTTTLFLEKLGLNTVHELPPLAPFLPDDVEELADATR
ncbi:SMC-Scp complex subunit ScpB [Micromonospora sp. WMMD967]|uniref:SMC-Scp complex subunit ScpB n=1 Tax=Micromonospora sp. WMMD967 TaxID=3016101 RepID=UPI0024165AEE|nr:SMC-Scp complex subunit ScpB [Micromonospora sp. WMMD967]MDG4838251.1 SMC-Scp complex subunit ScpB [Micromonospora sp. WMMD967]